MSALCSQVIDAIRAQIRDECRLLRSRADARGGGGLSLLDVGCWDGVETVQYQQLLGGRAYGIEVFPPQAAAAAARGVDVARVDLESEPFPWLPESVDVVIANQVFEHLKNIWHAMSEIARVVRPGGTLIFSVPNLSSLHNRVMLAVGLQPSSIRTFGPHIRGFSYRDARRFLTLGGFFALERVRPVGFYPLPIHVAGPVARLWPGASHTGVFVLRREAPGGSRPPWADLASGMDVGEQTFYRAAQPTP